MTPEEVLSKLDEILRTCDKNALPMICRRVQNSQGFLYVKNRIIFMVTKDQLSIEAALGQLESELNETI